MLPIYIYTFKELSLRGSSVCGSDKIEAEQKQCLNKLDYRAIKKLKDSKSHASNGDSTLNSKYRWCCKVDERWNVEEMGVFK